MPEAALEEVSVLMVVEDALERDAIARLVPSSYLLHTVHLEIEAAALAFEKAKPIAVLLAINDLDNCAAFKNALIKKCVPPGETAPCTVALCLQRHSPRAGEMCLQGIFDDFVTAKPNPHTERVHLALTRARMLKELRTNLAETSARLEAARNGFETLASLQGEWIGRATEMKTRSAPVREVAGLLDQVNSRVGELAAQGRNACAGRTKKILIVDDDEIMREILGATLESGGYEPCFASSAAEAVALLVHDRVSLILMDLMMPGVDGVAATREIRALPRYSSVPIIMVSGHGNRDSVKAARSVGASDFIVKPVDHDRLLEKIERFVG